MGKLGRGGGGEEGRGRKRKMPRACIFHPQKGFQPNRVLLSLGGGGSSIHKATMNHCNRQHGQNNSNPITTALIHARTPTPTALDPNGTNQAFDYTDPSFFLGSTSTKRPEFSWNFLFVPPARRRDTRPPAQLFPLSYFAHKKKEGSRLSLIFAK